jgi:anti-sigma28 factor (negative regulator of flagellin synthesis)
MEVQGPGGVSGPNRIEPQQVPARDSVGASELTSAGDRVEISEHAKLLEKLSEIPSMRTEKIEELRRLIEAGEFETPERLAGAVDKLMEEL